MYYRNHKIHLSRFFFPTVEIIFHVSIFISEIENLTFLLCHLKEFSKDRLLMELSQDGAKGTAGKGDAQDKSISAATIGASLGAGLGVMLAVVMGAASALRKP